MHDGLSDTEIELVTKYFDLSAGNEKPLAIWIIGRSAAGKTTTATLLNRVLRQTGHRTELADGDIMRSVLDGSLGYSAADRLSVFKKYVHINKLLQAKGIIPVTATIGGFQKFRELVRNRLENPRFIYLDCPIEEAAQRDQKGNYAKALAGELKNFCGIDIEYEVPVNYEIKIDSARLKPLEIVESIMDHFDRVGILRRR